MILGDTVCIYSIKVPTFLLDLVGIGEFLILGYSDGYRLDNCMTHLVWIPQRNDVLFSLVVWITKWGLPLLWYLYVIIFEPSIFTIDMDGMINHVGFNSSRSYLPFHQTKSSLHVVTYLRTSTLWVSLRDTIGNKRWNTISIDTWPVWKMNALHPQGHKMFGVIYLLHTCEIYVACWIQYHHPITSRSRSCQWLYI